MYLNSSRKKVQVVVFLTAYFTFFAFIAVFLMSSFWYRNDDLIISFLLKGILITENSTPYVYHMNIFLSTILELLESRTSIDIYSIFMYGILIMSAVIITNILGNKIKNTLISTSIISIVILPIFLRPTFSIVAGFVFISGIIMLFYSLEKESKILIASSLLLIYISSLIRDEVTYLGILVIIVWVIINLKDKIVNKNLILSSLMMLLLLGISYFLNAKFYNQESLRFGQNYERYISISINDYGASELLLKNNDILTRNNMTENDIKLIRNYFNADTSLADPLKVKVLLDEISWFNNFFHYDKSRLIDQLNYLFFNFNIYLITLLFIFSFLIIISSQKFIKAFIVFATSIIIFALLGRIEIYILYGILLTLFLLILFTFNSLGANKIQKFYLVSLIGIISISFLHLKSIPDFKDFQKDFKNVGKDSIWNWAGSLPIQQIFPLKTNQKNMNSIKVYDLGWSTFIPETNSFKSILPNSSFIDLLLSEQGVDVFANDFHVPLLDNYCRNNFGANLDYVKNKKIKTINLFNFKCNGTIPALTGNALEFDQNTAFIWLTSDNKTFELKNGGDKTFSGDVKIIFEKPNCDLNIAKFAIKSSKGDYYQVKNSDLLILNLDIEPKEVIEFNLMNKNLSACSVGEDARSLVSKLKLIE